MLACSHSCQYRNLSWMPSEVSWVICLSVWVIFLSLSPRLPECPQIPALQNKTKSTHTTGLTSRQIFTKKIIKTLFWNSYPLVWYCYWLQSLWWSFHMKVHYPLFILPWWFIRSVWTIMLQSEDKWSPPPQWIVIKSRWCLLQLSSVGVNDR